MTEEVLVALVAAIGNLLQGLDNATIAGAILYIKEEFNLQNEPTVEGLIVAMSLIGGIIVTAISGPLSDALGRRLMLTISSILYLTSSLVMFWSPNVYVLLFARLLDGFGIGLAVTQAPVYISETAPSESRGLLGTFPQLSGSTGMFLSYCMVFGMSLMDSPSWRLMLGVLAFPSLAYFVLTMVFLPESPRWLVSKGKMVEAKRVLQRLRRSEDVSAELALLVEGLGVGNEPTVEEYIIEPIDGCGSAKRDNQLAIYGRGDSISCTAKSISKQSIARLSTHGSQLMDPLVTIFGSFHGNSLERHGSALGSRFCVASHQVKSEEWDEESQMDGDQDYAHHDFEVDSSHDLQSPLLSKQATGVEIDKEDEACVEVENAKDLGGGWQLAWKLSERLSEDGRREVGIQRMYLHQQGTVDSRRGSILSAQGINILGEGDSVQATALVSQPVLYSQDLAVIHPTKTAKKGPNFRDLMEPGVKRALIVGIGLQALQQVAGINGVLYYTPQILNEAGVSVLLSNTGISSNSATFLMSALTTFTMLPCIVVAMKLMDISGRRSLMLSTIPILIISLLAIILSSIISLSPTVYAVTSTVSVIVYTSVFVMGFGCIPNILCAEIFPTKVRGVCIALCALTYWFGNISITYTFPAMLNSVGFTGVFGMYAVGCTISWIFVYLKVPETKGMPLEVISEFFALGARQPHTR